GQREVPAARSTRGPNPVRARDGAVPREDVPDEGRRVRRWAGGRRGGDDGDGRGPVIHRTALIDPTAELGADVSVGPYCVVGPRVTVGDRCALAGHAVIERNTRVGDGGKIGYGTIIRHHPPTRKYKGEDTWV